MYLKRFRNPERYRALEDITIIKEKLEDFKNLENPKFIEEYYKLTPLTEEEVREVFNKIREKENSVIVPTCDKCKHLGYNSPAHDQPYPEFWCTKQQWDGLDSYDSLYEETKCEKFEQTT